MDVGRDASDLAGAGDNVAVVVAPQVEPRFLQFGVINVFDPLTTRTRPTLIDQELVMILDEKLGGVARLLFGIAETAASQHQIACEDRCAALSDEAFANDRHGYAEAGKVERSIAAGRTSPHHHHIRRRYFHWRFDGVISVGRKFS